VSLVITSILVDNVVLSNFSKEISFYGYVASIDIVYIESTKEYWQIMHHLIALFMITLKDKNFKANVLVLLTWQG